MSLALACGVFSFKLHIDPKLLPCVIAAVSWGFNPHMDYTTWKEHAAAELAARHDVRVTSIPEREWKRLFIVRSSPAGAASRAYTFWLNSQPAKFRTSIRREIGEALRTKQTPRERLAPLLKKKIGDSPL